MSRKGSPAGPEVREVMRMESGERMERRKFLGKAGRWAVGLAALGLAGSLASCGNESSTATSSDTGTAPSSGSGSGSLPQSPPTTTGASAVVTSKCVGCGKCTRACEQGAISLSGKKAVISDACIGCGDCVRYCPAGAIVLVQSSGGTVTFKPGELDEVLTAA